MLIEAMFLYFFFAESEAMINPQPSIYQQRNYIGRVEILIKSNFHSLESME